MKMEKKRGKKSGVSKTNRKCDCSFMAHRGASLPSVLAEELLGRQIQETLR